MLERNKFRGAIVSRGYTVDAIADLVGINQATLYRKINGTSEFTRQEIQTIRLALDMSDEEVMNIFFAD